ncbi:hypothetical protein [Nostoc sp.]|uniref:hypothetical protein n=1 Tax=Nostoc sp. TaxID=1180 RepID=UPI002FFA4DA6
MSRIEMKLLAAESQVISCLGSKGSDRLALFLLARMGEYLYKNIPSNRHCLCRDFTMQRL